MAVIVELRVSASDFEFGRLFTRLDASGTIELESLVPIPGGTTPFVWITGDGHDSMTDRLGSHPTVIDVERIESLSDRSLYALEWFVEYDHLFRALRERTVQILSAHCTDGVWEFSLRFHTHRSLSQFQDYCKDARIDLEVAKVYNMPEETSDESFGVTQRQREALILAVREGYYDLPRNSSTSDLADQLQISDQAVSERLRRAIATLVRNTLMNTSY